MGGGGGGSWGPHWHYSDPAGLLSTFHFSGARHISVAISWPYSHLKRLIVPTQQTELCFYFSLIYPSQPPTPFFEGVISWRERIIIPKKKI